MLSNTAVPKYYAAFRDKVIAGKIPVCETISLEMNRIDDLIENPGVYYDESKVDGYIKFCESELTKSDGTDLNLLDTFKLWAEQVYGWYYFVEKTIYVPNKDNRGGRYIKKKVKKRLINKQYIITSRGSAKTVYVSTIQAHGLIVDKRTTQQVTVAPTMRQAEETMTTINTAITRARGPLFKFLTEGNINNTNGNRINRVKLTKTKKGIENFMTNSLLETRPMSVDKLQGFQYKYASVDEWLSGDINEDVIGALEQGASKVPDWLILAISSEGTVRNSVGDSIKMELMDILKGEYINPHVSIFWYKLDDIKEVADPNKWLKASPNLGYTVDYETYHSEVKRAEKVPSTRNDMLAKRFGIAVEGYTYYFSYEETKRSRSREYWNLPCALGIDLSQGDDFCAFTFLFPLRNGKFGIKAKAYISDRTMKRLSITNTAMKMKYEEFLEEGTLTVMDGSVLDMMEVYEDIIEYIDNSKYTVICLGYDPYNAKTFIERWGRENGEYGIEKVPQGAKTESVPLGEIKALSEDGCLLFDQSIMSYSIGNCIVLKDSNNNKKLYKKRSDQKIDNVAALLDAYIAYKAYQEDF